MFNDRELVVVVSDIVQIQGRNGVGTRLFVTVPHRFEGAGICKLHLACELDQAQSIAALNFFYSIYR